MWVVTQEEGEVSSAVSSWWIHPELQLSGSGASSTSPTSGKHFTLFVFVSFQQGSLYSCPNVFAQCLEKKKANIFRPSWLPFFALSRLPSRPRTVRQTKINWTSHTFAHWRSVYRWQSENKLSSQDDTIRKVFKAGSVFSNKFPLRNVAQMCMTECHWPHSLGQFQ